MNWRPSSGPAVAARRAMLLDRVRQFFAERDVLAVDTPALSQAAVTDPNIDSLTVDAVVSDAPLYLTTSPEFAMKRLLADGYPDIYSVCRVFRDGELGRRHEPEFTMIEWYRHDFSLPQIIAESCALIGYVLDRPSLPGQATSVEYRAAFSARTGLDPFDAPVDALAAAANADAELRRSLGEDRDGWLDLLFTTEVASRFDSDRLTIVSHFPASQAALARISPDDDRVSDRFEVFSGGMELANGYVELTDAFEQRRRLEDDLDRRRQAGKPMPPVDEHLLAALEHGLPACAGVAIGFERLHMLHEGADDIRDVIPFSFGADTA